ncbi:MAG: SnoaL-like domain-containing protein [Bacteroidota bacterium]
MTTQEVADRFVEMARSGQLDSCYTELFHQDAVAYEMEGMPNHITKGVDNLIAKSAEYNKNIKEFHGFDISDPVVAPGFFSVYMMIDTTNQEGKRQKGEEICVYEVKDGKIVSERFFYQT